VLNAKFPPPGPTFPKPIQARDQLSLGQPGTPSVGLTQNGSIPSAVLAVRIR
jgi:hypothetical protein